MNMPSFLDHLNEVASSPYALIGYITVVAAWVYVATAHGRLKSISHALKDLPESERAGVIVREYNTTPRAGLSAELHLGI